MNWIQFKNPVSSMCLVAVVACWSLTQKMESTSPFAVMTNIFVIEFAEFSETFRKYSIDRKNLALRADIDTWEVQVFSWNHK